MRNSTRRIFTCCVIAVVVTLSTESQARDPSPLQRFQSEAPLAWSKLIELASCVEGECTAKKIDRTSGKFVLQEGPLAFRINGLLAYRPMSGNGKKRIMCQNLEYEFIVDELGAGRWGIKQLLWKDRTAQEFAKQPYSNQVDGRIGKLPWQSALACACRGLIINITWLPHLASSPTFKVIEATKVTDDASGGDLVRVRFTNKAIRGPAVTIEGGEVTLDAKRYWLIVEALVNAHYGNEGPKQFDLIYNVANEFEVADDRLPYAARQTLRTQSLFPMLDEEDIYETKIVLKDKSDVKPFRLPAFGLPEPSKEP